MHIPAKQMLLARATCSPILEQIFLQDRLNSAALISLYMQCLVIKESIIDGLLFYLKNGKVAHKDARTVSNSSVAKWD